jgi:nucleotide-binding universal stress UspA family protein
MRKPSFTAGGLADSGAEASNAEAPSLKRVLVGFDERPASRDALTLAKVLCEHAGAELILASVRAYWSELIGPETYEQAVAEDEAWLAREGRKVLGSERFSTNVIAGGHETGGLKEIAAAEDADLLVIGSTHRGKLGRVLPGSVGERVLNNAPCAVAIAPRGLADSGFRLRQIAVGYDGSIQAHVALRLARALAEQSGAPLLVLGAVEIEPGAHDLVRGSVERIEDTRMLRALEKARSSLPDSIPVETRLLHGPPHQMLTEAAQGADLLVIGSRGRYGPMRRVFLGGVATRVARSAPCSTLITPA